MSDYQYQHLTTQVMVMSILLLAWVGMIGLAVFLKLDKLIEEVRKERKV
jgi:hypothetical protein